MAISLLTTRTQVRSNLDEPATEAADWSDTELNRVINQRYHQVISAVMTVYEDYYLTTATFASVANQQEYTAASALPSNIFKLRRVELNYQPSVSTSANTRCLPIDTLDVVRRDLAFSNSGIGVRTNQTTYYYTYGFGSALTIGFLPIPSETGATAGKLWYIATQADLSADGDSVNIPYAERYYRLIADGATADALRFGQQDVSSADKLEAKFLGDLATMQQELEDKVAEESKMVMDTAGDVLDFYGGY